MKTAIIASGGGMTCSYSVGAILALVDKFKLKKPDIVIGCSGSAGPLAYYVAQQYNSIRKISKFISTKKLINYLRVWKILNIDYLIDDIFKKIEPLNIKKLKASKIQFLISVTNYNTGELEYFSNKDDINLFEVLRATKAMPIAYNKAISLNNKKYCDTHISTSIMLNALKAIELGAKKLIILDNRQTNKTMDKGFKFWLCLRNKIFRKNYKNYMTKIKQFEIPKDIEVIYIKPKEKLRVSALSNNKHLMTETIDLGYDEIYQREDLYTFLNARDTNDNIAQKVF